MGGAPSAPPVAPLSVEGAEAMARGRRRRRDGMAMAGQWQHRRMRKPVTRVAWTLFRAGHPFRLVWRLGGEEGSVGRVQTRRRGWCLFVLLAHPFFCFGYNINGVSGRMSICAD